MSRLEDLQSNAAVRGILPDCLVTVVGTGGGAVVSEKLDFGPSHPPNGPDRPAITCRRRTLCNWRVSYSKAEVARELAYRLYTICERKKRAQEALSYNGLVQSWPEILRLAREGSVSAAQQEELF